MQELNPESIILITEVHTGNLHNTQFTPFTYTIPSIDLFVSAVVQNNLTSAGAL